MVAQAASGACGMQVRAKAWWARRRVPAFGTRTRRRAPRRPPHHAGGGREEGAGGQHPPDRRRSALRSGKREPHSSCVWPQLVGRPDSSVPSVTARGGLCVFFWGQISCLVFAVWTLSSLSVNLSCVSGASERPVLRAWRCGTLPPPPGPRAAPSACWRGMNAEPPGRAVPIPFLPDRGLSPPAWTR